jgi:hypothetical protein
MSGSERMVSGFLVVLLVAVPFAVTGTGVLETAWRSRRRLY